MPKTDIDIMMADNGTLFSKSSVKQYFLFVSVTKSDVDIMMADNGTSFSKSSVNCIFYSFQCLRVMLTS